MPNQIELTQVIIPITRSLTPEGNFRRQVANHFLAQLQTIWYDTPSSGVYATTPNPTEQITLVPDNCETQDIRDITEALLAKMGELHPLLTQLLIKRQDWKASQSQDSVSQPENMAGT